MASNKKQPILEDQTQNVKPASDAQLVSQSDAGTKRKLTINYKGGKKVILDCVPTIHKPPITSQPAHYAQPTMDVKRVETASVAGGNVPEHNTLVIPQPNTGTRKMLNYTQIKGAECILYYRNIANRSEPSLVQERNVNSTRIGNTSSNGNNVSHSMSAGPEKKTRYLIAKFVPDKQKQPSPSHTDNPPSGSVRNSTTVSPSLPTTKSHLSSTSTVSGKSGTIPSKKGVCYLPSPGAEFAFTHKQIMVGLNKLTAAVNNLASTVENEIKELKKEVQAIPRHEQEK